MNKPAVMKTSTPAYFSDLGYIVSASTDTSLSQIILLWGKTLA
jgi:hypothetical protein